MNWKRFSLVALVACAPAAVLAWAAQRDAPDEHRKGRQLALYHTLSRTSDPVIVVGDSIVEASSLPRSICGHPIVNAGLNGASTASDLGSWLAPALAGKRAGLIVVALGVNDALQPGSQGKPDFEDRFGALLTALSKLTPKLAVLAISPVEAQGQITDKMRDELMASVDAYNSILPDLAKRNGAAFVALPAMPRPHTIDGVHMNSDGDLVWDKAVMQAASMVCG